MFFYPNIPHQAGLSALKEAFENKSVKKIPTENLIKMAEFVLKNNLFEFNNKMFQQISGTAIVMKLSPPKTFIYVDRVDQCFLEKLKQPFLCLIYIVFFLFFVFLFIWTHGKEELKKFMEKFDNFTTNLRFTYKSIEKEISILDPWLLYQKERVFSPQPMVSFMAPC